MSQTTAIEWTDVSWNPVHGCSKVSPGCAHCYAETLSRRYKQTPAPWTPANASENVILKPHKLREPLKWKEPRMVFVNSMSDLFHELVPDDYIADVFSVMARCPQHTFQVLTKRPERMHDLMLEPPFEADLPTWPLPNVWLGVSIENRRFVGRAEVLRQTRAAVRFISAEPLLGPLIYDDRSAQGHYALGGFPDDLTIRGDSTIWERHWHDEYEGDELDLTDIDWLIVGGESGPGHRPIDLGWVRDLRDECQREILTCCRMTDAFGRCCGQPDNDGPRTAFFVKQVGGARPGTKLEDLPADLRIREFPSRVAS